MDQFINVYTLEQDGRDLTDEAAEYVQGVICSAVPALADMDFVMHAGTELHDPAALADVLERHPDNSFVVVAEPDSKELVFCKFGPGEDGIAAVIGILRDGASRVQPGGTSWEILWASIDEGRTGRK